MLILKVDFKQSIIVTYIIHSTYKWNLYKIFRRVKSYPLSQLKYVHLNVTKRVKWSIQNFTPYLDPSM